MTRPFLALVPALFLATATLAVVPTADAVATCTAADPECPSLVCIGYNSQTGWQKCYPRDWIPDDIPVPCRDHPCWDPLP